MKPPKRRSAKGSTSTTALSDTSAITDDCSLDSIDDFESAQEQQEQEQVRRTRHSTSSSSRGLLTKEIVKTFFMDYYSDYNSTIGKPIECWKEFYQNYHSDTYRCIRPSGNPISSEGFIQMFSDSDLVMEESILVSIDSIKILVDGIAAVTVLTVEQKFQYKGIQNHDRAVFTSVIELQHSYDTPKLVHDHRTMAIPIPKQSRWTT